MSKYNNIRNFGIIAHIDAGKTTTTERVLYLTGMNHKIGEVDEGTTITDWMQEERERGITIVSAAVSCKWNENIFHIIDTPGHVDFTAEVHRSLRVLDGAVVVFCAVGGVQTQSETVWKQADDFHIPRIVFINKLDRVGADYDNVLNEIQTKLKKVPLPIIIPYYKEERLEAVISLISMQKIIFNENGTIKEEQKLHEDALKTAAPYREKMIDIITQYDDSLLESALNGELTEQQIIASIRKNTINQTYVPVLCGSSLKNIGVPPLLNAISHYLPSPDDIGYITGFFPKKNIWDKIYFDRTDLPVAYIFKMQYHREKGPLAFARVYSGKIKNGQTLYNPRTKKRERVQDLLTIFADKFERIDSANAGDIVTISGFKDCITSDTLCLENNQVVLEQLHFPEPVIFVRIEPKNTVDKEKFDHAKDHILLEDPTITCKEDPETGQTLIGGMGELHIQIFIDRIRKEYGVDLKTGTPYVGYKETPKVRESYEFEFNQKIEGNVQHIQVKLSVIPGERNSGNEIQSSLSKKYSVITQNIKNGINNALKSGPEAAYPVTDCIINIDSIDLDINRTPVLAIEAACNMCCSYLLKQAGTDLLEPIMKLEMEIPTSFTGSVMGELQSRGGTILDIIKKINQDVIMATAPLKQMFGYTTTLRSLTQGKGTFSMNFFQYDQV